MVTFDTDRRYSRRTVLKSGLAGIAAVGLTGTASAYHELSDEYDTVVDVVDAGADNSGERPINDVLADLRGDDTLLIFPDGRYYMNEKFRFTDFEHFGLVGKEDATLVPPDYWGFDDDSHKLFRLGTHYAPGRDLHIENFTVDFTAPNTGARTFEATVSDGLTVKNVDVVGRHDSGTWGPGLFRVTDPDGTGLVAGFRAPDGGAANDETPADMLEHGGPSGIITNWSHRGTIRYRNCVLGAFPDNGLYAAGGDGTVVVDGGTYRNSGTASIRLGGDGGTIDGATVVVDDDPFGYPQEGIRLDYGDWFELVNLDVNVPKPNGEAINVQDPVGGAFLKHSSVYVGEDADVGVRINSGVGPTYFEDVDVAIDGSNNAIQVLGPDAAEVNLVDVTVTGDAGGETMRHAIRCERDGCQFRGLTVDQPGGNQRRGLAILGDDAFVYDCAFTCTQRGISVRGDGAWIQDCDSDPYDDDRYSIRIYDSADGTRLKDNDFPDGVVWG